MITSLSGVRGILNHDMTIADVSRFAGNFAAFTKGKEILVARDTRKTGPAMTRAVAAGVMSQGADVMDYGVVSTPALFRESRMRQLPAVMVTASHNEPEFNGLKFIVDGRGIVADGYEAVVQARNKEGSPFSLARQRRRDRSSYVDDLVERFGEGSCKGVSVALDLGGGAATTHSVKLLTRLGCDVVSLNDAPGIFNRKIDPVADELRLLRKIVKTRRCDIGLGFDCDGDRLVIVDADGNKRTGDYMLTLAMSEMISGTEEKSVVVSQDTTQAIEEVVKEAGGEVFRSRVGEANVVGRMAEKGVRIGGEGSSGGFIDAEFNYCRDSMLASLIILRALKRDGHEAYDSVASYHQVRVALRIPRTRAQRAIKRLAMRYGDSDSMDGVKIRVSKHSWVLLRPSGTEDLVRVSAEAKTSSGADKIANAFSKKLKELSK